jgi:hypothetical protein
MTVDRSRRWLTRRRTGVCPFGAHVVPVLARQEKPVSSTNMISACWRHAFFNLGPIRPEPGPHQGIIAFPGIDGWVLRAPAQRLQPTGQVVGMVAHPKGHQNHRTDAQECSPLRLKAGRESTFVEDCSHALPRLNGQAGWPAGNGPSVPAGHIALTLAELLRPFADGHPPDAQSAGDVGLGEWSGLEKPAGF